MENVLERYERHAHIGQLVGDGDDSQVPLRTIAFIIIYANVIMHHPRL